jgi:hypothetical protein
MGIKIFNNLPPYIKDVSNNVKKFENCLKQFLRIHSFYSLQQYFLQAENVSQDVLH